MPTGYTSEVSGGKITTLPAFLRLIARNFMLDLRDEPWGVPLPRESSIQKSGMDWSATRKQEALDEIHRLHGLTAVQLDTEAAGAYEADKAAWDGRRARKLAEQDRYNAMIALVRAWECPPAMGKMKAFAMEQLRESRRFDCEPITSEFDPEPQRLPGPEWLEQRLKKLRRKVDYHGDEEIKSKERYENWSSFYATVCDEIERLEREQPILSPQEDASQ